MDIVLLASAGADMEKMEYQGEITWEPVDPAQLSAEFSDYINGDYAGTNWRADGPNSVYSVIDQFIDAAQGQPGVVFGFRAGMGMPKVLLKYEDGQYLVGRDLNAESFSSVDGNDMDYDEDDLDIYPPPRGGGSYTEASVKSIVIGLIKNESRGQQRKRRITDATAMKIAMSLLDE